MGVIKVYTRLGSGGYLSHMYRRASMAEGPVKRSSGDGDNDTREEYFSSDDNSSDESGGDLDMFAEAASIIAPLDSDKENKTEGGQKTGSGRYENGTRRREHTMCERKRRQGIREAFSTLQGHLPNTQNIRLSKLEVIRASITHIRSLRMSVEQLETEISSLDKKKMRLTTM